MIQRKLDNELFEIPGKKQENISQANRAIYCYMETKMSWKIKKDFHDAQAAPRTGESQNRE